MPPPCISMVPCDMVVGYELVETWLARVKSVVPMDDMLAGMGTWCDEPEEDRPVGADLFFEGACRIDPASSCSGNSSKSACFALSVQIATYQEVVRPYLESTSNSLCRHAFFRQRRYHIPSGSSISKNLTRSRFLGVFCGIKYKREDSKELGVQHEPVRPTKHSLFTDFESNVYNIARDANCCCRARIRKLINLSPLTQARRNVMQKWSVQNKLDMCISKS